MGRLEAGHNLEGAVGELLATTEYPQVARWIQFPAAVALFPLVPSDPEAAAIHVYDQFPPQAGEGHRFGRTETDLDATRRLSAATRVSPRILAMATKKRSAGSPCGELKRLVSSTISAVSGASFSQGI
jgi:hypothetical protein